MKAVRKTPVRAVAKPKKKEEEEKGKLSKELKQKIAQLQSVEPSGDGHYELNQLMSRALETELQDLMTKVQQELPETSSSAEKLVADKFRNEAGDDLKNVLGLNVSKRILNVFNPMFVKIKFDKQPFGFDRVQSLLRWLNCTSMKRVLDGPHNYVAQLRNIADFDRAAAKKVIRVGQLTAKLTPHYKFTSCPSKLKTIYKVKRSTKKETSEKTEQLKTEENDSKTSATTSVIKTDNKPVPKEEKPVQKPKTEGTKTVEKPKENKVEEPAKKTGIKPEAEKKPVASKVQEKANTIKTPVKKTEPALKKDANVSKTTSEATPRVKTPVKKTETAPKKDANVSKTTSEATPRVKTPVKKTETAPKKDANASKTTPEAIPSAKDSKRKIDKNKTAQATATKPTTKTKSATTKNKTDKPKQRNKSDFDELDDADILALMSNAIVLDECTGSDED